MTTPAELSEERLRDCEQMIGNSNYGTANEYAAARNTFRALVAFYRANAGVAAKPSEPVATGERLSEEDVLCLTTFANSFSTELRGLTVDERRVRLRRYVAQCIQEAKPAIVKAACDAVRIDVRGWVEQGNMSKSEFASVNAALDAVERSVKGG